MVLCKFFLQGTCKFGDNCKFEHQLNDHSYGGTSILVQNHANKPQPTTNVDTTTLVKSVVNDMTSAEKGGQWLLSSYAPFKEKPAFPGFEDHSMEEIRYLFYESVKNGSIEQYKQTLQMMLQQAMMKIKALQNPSPEAVAILKNIYDTAPSSSNQSSMFGASQPTVFSNTNQNSFGGNPQSMFTGNTNPIFVGQASNSVFGGQPPQNKSIFGNTAPQTANNSIFSATPPQTNSNSIFGGTPAQSASNPIFGHVAPPQTTSNSIFGAAALQNTNNPIFANNASVFANTTQQTVFAKPQQNFGPNNQYAQNQNSPFGQSPSAQDQTPHLFAQPAPISSPFGQNPLAAAQPNLPISLSQKPAMQHSQNIFGNLNQPSLSGGVSQTQPNPEFYSKLEELSEEEIKWFQCNDLDLTTIPDKPPTYEMCFKM